MHILNKHGQMHTTPDDWAVPAGARKATAAEIAAWEKEDAANKAAIKAAKEQTKQDRAQVVIQAAPVEPAGKTDDDAAGNPDGKGDGKGAPKKE
jgi:hypothetical protein